MNDEHELGYEEPSQAEKWETGLRKIGLPCVAIFVILIGTYFAIRYWSQ